MKYKVGDKVRVRRDLKEHKEYYMDDKTVSDVAVCAMVVAGHIVVIDGVDVYYSVKGIGYNWTDEMFEPVNDLNRKIVITTDGTETLARLYDGEKVVKTATAKCSPDDTFDFATGARLAYDRLMGDDKATVDPLKIKVGKKYLLKPYGEVKDHLSIAKSTWDRLEGKPITIQSKSEYGTFLTDACLFFLPEAFKCEYIEQKPQCYNGKVVCVEKGYKNSAALSCFTVGKVYTVTDGILLADRGYKTERYKTLEELCRGVGYKLIPLVE